MSSHDASAVPSTREIDLVAILGILWRYKIFIAAVSLLIGLLAAYVALTATEIYRAEIILSDAHDNTAGASKLLSGSLGGLASLAGFGNLGNNDLSQEGQATLNSYRLPAEFIRRNGLVDELMAGTGENASVWYATKRFRETILSVDQDKLTGITTVGIEWKNPAVAARWANQYVAMANELIRARAVRVSSRNIAYLKAQLDQTKVLEMQQVLYDLIENETKTLMLANGREEYAFTIIDPAVAPEQRIRPKRTLLVLTGLVLGGVLGSGLALAHNTWRRWRRETRAAQG